MEMDQSSPWRAVGAGLCATLVGIGIARFGYSPLIPAIIAAGWFGAAQAAYLGAANLAGYLVGALIARLLARRIAPAWLLRGTMLLVAASFLACAAPASFAWFLAWRALSGLAGGVIMVLAAPLVLPHVPAGRRGLAGGLIFTGVGSGIVLSGSLLPHLLHVGLGLAWTVLAAICLLLTVIAWRGWPADPAAREVPAAAPAAYRGALVALSVLYALDAIGVVPHLIFLVDYVARGLHHGITVGASLWAVFGCGAALGPLSFGYLGDRIGFRTMLRLTLAIQAAALLAASFCTGLVPLAISGFIIGAFTPGIAPVMLGRIRDLLPGDIHAQQGAWRLTTIAFALGQAGGAYGLPAIFLATGYRGVFLVGFAALAAALATDLAVGPDKTRRGALESR